MESTTQTYNRLKENRDEGIKLLFELYAKKLQGYAINKWKTEPDTAWDIIYKTIYKVADVVNQYQFESEEKFASFIFKIFINYLRNQFRDTNTLNAGIKEVELSDYVINNYSPTAGSENKSIELNLLQYELDKLEDWQRILLLMRSQDVPYAEISKYTGKSEDQLKVYYGRLKKQISEKIANKLRTIKVKTNA